MAIHSISHGGITLTNEQLTGELALTGEQVFATTGTSNDVALSGGVTVFRFTGNGSCSLTGFSGGYNGRLLLLVNESVGSGTITLSHLTGSAAGNQLVGLAGSNQTISYEGGALLRYDGASSKWRLVAVDTAVFTAAITASGGLSSNSTTTLAAAVSFTNTNNPASLSGTTNDWAPTTAFRQRIAASAAATITGFSPGVGSSGRLNWFQNLSAFNITLTHEGAGSTAANRFTCPRSVDLVIPPNGNAYVIYDTTTSRWIVFGDASCWSQGAGTLSGDFTSFPWASGRYYLLPNASTTTTGQTGNGSMRAGPTYVPNAVTVTRLGAEVTVAGDVGSKVRLGIYGDDGTGRPGALVLDAGTIAGDATGYQEITGLSTVIGPGWYYFAAVIQLVTVTQPTLRTTVTSVPVIVDGNTTPPSALSGINSGFSIGSITGALPNPFGAGVASANSLIRVAIRL